MTDLNMLKEKFHRRMITIYETAKAECGYNPSYFIESVEQRGGLGTAKELLAKKGHSDGLTRLWEEGRLDISLEAAVLEAQWAPLFTEQELASAKRRLTALDYFKE